MYFVLLIPALLLLAYYMHSIQFSTRGMPPGPFVLPIIGCGIGAWLRRPVFRPSKIRPWEYLDMLSKEFGDIFSFSILQFDAVIIASHELLTEVANMEEFSNKFSHEIYTYPRTFGKELGIGLVSSPPLWTEMRRFTLRTLRDFGFGKEYTMHGIITTEANLAVQDLKRAIKFSAGIVKFRTNFSLPVINMLWCLVAGVRYDHDDPSIRKLLDHVYLVSKTLTYGNPIEIFTPFVHRFAPKLSSFLGISRRYKLFDECNQMSLQFIEERKAEGFYLTDPQNYIDVFLRKIHDDEKAQKQGVYSVQQLQAMLSDLLAAGSLTVNGTLNYGILYLTMNPRIQRKCQEEIDEIVGPARDPTEDDIHKMPYFQAFILELHRVACVVPNPIPRLCPKEWNIRGYRVPKGAILFSNHFSLNMSQEIWGDPHNFRPERFIDENGEFVSDPRVAIFGYGKRICMGMSLVNAVVPLFLATLLRKFTFSVIPGTQPLTPEPEIGTSLSPKEFSVFVCERSSSE